MSLSADATTGAPGLSFDGLLESGKLQSALRAGLPLRIHVVAELWRDRFFDDQEGRAEWRASVVYDPLAGTYTVRTSAPGRDGTGGPGAAEDAARDPAVVNSLADVRSRLEERFDVALRPVDEGTYYYMAVVEVETLSLSDLEELQRWLRGDLAPAVGGEEDVEGAVGRGVQQLVVRLLGLPARRLRVRTDKFDFVPGGAGG